MPELSVMQEISARAVGPGSAKKLAYLAQELQKQVSPAGRLGLPKLLDERRLEHMIIDSAFDWAPGFDRVFVYQIPESKDGKFIEGGIIYQPDDVREASAFYSTRGIVVSAGLLAQEHLGTNGMDLGHEVIFATTIVRQVIVGRYGTKEFPLLVMSSADIQGSKDTRRLILSGELIVKEGEDGRLKYFRKDGTSLGVPMQPPTQAEYI